jgi:hypothetical protein
MLEKQSSNSGVDRHATAHPVAVNALWSVSTEAIDTAFKAATRTQAEWTSLVGRRSRAWLDVPKQAAACRNPAEAVRAQMAFWQTAWHQYTETSQRLVAAWTPVWTSALSAATAERDRDRRQAQSQLPSRDFMSLPEASEPVRPGERRAA